MMEIVFDAKGKGTAIDLAANSCRLRTKLGPGAVVSLFGVRPSAPRCTGSPPPSAHASPPESPDLVRAYDEVGSDGRPRSERMTEAEAIDALRGGSAEGLECLMAEHEVRALRVAYAITGKRATAEDVVSEAFLKAYRRIYQFQCGRRFERWFLRIVPTRPSRQCAR